MAERRTEGFRTKKTPFTLIIYLLSNLLSSGHGGGRGWRGRGRGRGSFHGPSSSKYYKASYSDEVEEAVDKIFNRK